MSDTLHIIAIWTHILGIALWVGPQFFLAFAWVPASRKIADPATRIEAMRTITKRFAYLGGFGLLLILIAGLYLITSWKGYYHYGGPFYDIRFGWIFTIKMLTLAVMLAVIGFHTFVTGPKLLRLMEGRLNGEDISDADIHAARMQSMYLSITGLLLTLVIMVFGAMLNTVTFSLR